MKEFKEKLQRKTNVMAILCCFAPIMLMALKLITKRSADFSAGIVQGFFIGFILCLVYSAARNFAALNDDEKLKAMYVAENDERNIAIEKETGKTFSRLGGICLAFAAVAASFFNITVSLTLGCAVLFLSAVWVAVRVYYNKKM